MDDITREKLLKIALTAIGAIFFTIYPLSLIWPAWWPWPVLLSDDLRGLRGSRCLSYCCRAQSFRTSQLDLVHDLVEHRARRHHGSTGYV